MSQAIADRAARAEFDAFVVGLAFGPGNRPAFGLGDGTLRLGLDGPSVTVHEGAVLALTATPRGFATGGDDGLLALTGPDGATQAIARFGGRWVEHLAAWGDGRGALLAAASGRTVHLFDGAGQKLKELTHPSTVAGLAFDARGKRVGAAHYGGASLWFVGARADTPRRLEWKGSHIGIAIHPGGDAVVTAMQENALHGWRLSDGQHMRMSGYPSKTESLSFSRAGKWLASSGAESIVLWPFFGGGPMGKPPLELAGGDNVPCTRVAFHPQQDVVAAGFGDGLVVLAEIATHRVLPVSVPPAQGQGAVSALAWSPDGTHLAFGTEAGHAELIDLSNHKG